MCTISSTTDAQCAASACFRTCSYGFNSFFKSYHGQEFFSLFLLLLLPSCLYLAVRREAQAEESRPPVVWNLWSSATVISKRCSATCAQMFRRVCEFLIITLVQVPGRRLNLLYNSAAKFAATRSVKTEFLFLFLLGALLFVHLRSKASDKVVEKKEVFTCVCSVRSKQGLER